MRRLCDLYKPMGIFQIRKKKNNTHTANTYNIRGKSIGFEILESFKLGGNNLLATNYSARVYSADVSGCQSIPTLPIKIILEVILSTFLPPFTLRVVSN